LDTKPKNPNFLNLKRFKTYNLKTFFKNLDFFLALVMSRPKSVADPKFWNRGQKDRKWGLKWGHRPSLENMLKFYA